MPRNAIAPDQPGSPQKNWSSSHRKKIERLKVSHDHGRGNSGKEGSEEKTRDDRELQTSALTLEETAPTTIKTSPTKPHKECEYPGKVFEFIA